MFPAASCDTVAATATDTGTTIESPPFVSTIAPEYMPYGVPAGTAIDAANEPAADAGVRHPRPVGVLVPVDLDLEVRDRDRRRSAPSAGGRGRARRPSAHCGLRTNDMSAFEPARWYMNRTYSPWSISDFLKSRSRKASGFEIVFLVLWSTTPSPSLSVQRFPSPLMSVQL